MKEKAVFSLKLLLGFAIGFGFLAFVIWDRQHGGGTFGHLEQQRIARDAISKAGHDCNAIQSTRQEAKALFVDCGRDGFYAIVETVDGGIQIMKR